MRISQYCRREFKYFALKIGDSGEAGQEEEGFGVHQSA